MKAALTAFLTSLFFALFALHSASSVAKPQARKTTLQFVFAMDGLSYETFRAARSMGMFQNFSDPTPHIAPYPSMTEPSWTEVFHRRKVFGEKGSLESYEASFVNTTENRIHQDPRDVFIRNAAPESFFRSFDYYLSPFIEPLLYFPGQNTAKLELDQVHEKFIEALNQEKKSQVFYVSAVDAIAHTQYEKLYPLLYLWNAKLKELKNTAKKQNKKIEFWIISDHGNVGAFVEGKKETHLKPVDPKEFEKITGFNRISDGKLEQEHDFALPVLALGNYGAITLKNPNLKSQFARKIIEHQAVDLVTYTDYHTSEKPFIIVLKKHSEAKILWNDRGEMAYVNLLGNPLQIPKNGQSANDQNLKWITTEEVRRFTGKTDYPDSLVRLVQQAKLPVKNPPDILFDLKPDYHLTGSLDEYVNMVRTHGSLHRLSSAGVVVGDSNRKPHFPFFRAAEILPFIGVPAESMPLHSTGTETELNTHNHNLDPDLIFRRWVRILESTIHWMNADEIQGFKEAFLKLQSQSREPKLDQLKKQYSTESLIKLLDEMIGLKEKINPQTSVDEIKSLFQNLIFQWDPRLKNQTAMDSKLGSSLRQALMKLYSSPFLLNEILSLPEFGTLPDERTVVRAKPGTHPKDLFQSILTERNLFHDLTPVHLPLHYPSQSNSFSEVTFVYAPGIVNELFDQEIFSKGLYSIQKNLGYRVLTLDLPGQCSSSQNANLILSQLKQDLQNQKIRGFPKPRYVFLSYSKGAIDTLHAIDLDPGFFQKHGIAMVSIAAPLQGTLLAEKTSFPQFFLDQFTGIHSKSKVQGCKSEQAMKSITPPYLKAFWEKSGTKVGSTIPLFSISFQTSARDAHPWMKLTKTLAGFDSPNDGVVQIKDSKFPEWLHAQDLGVQNGDHLSGILASNFRQEPFLDALVLTLQELGLFHDHQIQTWRSDAEIRMKEVLSKQESSRTFSLSSDSSMDTKNHTDRFQFPQSVSSESWTLGQALDLRSMAKTIQALPLNQNSHPTGIHIVFDHPSVKAFRQEYRFSYESTSPQDLDDQANGFSSLRDDGLSVESPLCLRMISNRNSVRMTSPYLKFSVTDFQKIQLKLKVTKGIQGQDCKKAGTGKDDSAFQLWLTLKDKRSAESEYLLFGYYWVDPNHEGKRPDSFEMIENYYSKKNLFIVKLPESFQMNVNTKDHTEGQWIHMDRNWVKDLKKAYPKINPEHYEVVAITLQSDSNDTRGSTEAYFKELRFRP